MDEDGRDAICPLAPSDVERLRLDGTRGLEPEDVLALVVQAPGLSFWHPPTGEFILVTPWRHRPELPSIHTLVGFRHETALIAAATDAAWRANAAALVYVDTYEVRRPAFYVTNGFERIEDILTFELSRPAAHADDDVAGRQQFMPVSAHDPEWLEAALALDHATFPWLWWNSREEFRSYLQYPGVEVWVGVANEDVVSYVGFTDYYGWGHLDRIATHPHVQGRGYGREAAQFAIRRMVAHGARRVALSTQGDNQQSQRLYARLGFHRTPSHDYRVYAIVFDRARLGI
ncbi:MAG: GNAT family N-acetyltransferase [Thermomicrobiales bacterium]